MRLGPEMGEGGAGSGLVEIEGRLDALSHALARDGVRLACLFGSVLEHPLARDVDVAVLFSEYSFERYLETLEATCRALGMRGVDLVVLNRANPLLKLRALLGGKLLFAETPMAQAEAVAETLFEYEDYRRFMAEYRQYLDWRCQEGLSVAARRVDCGATTAD